MKIQTNSPRRRQAGYTALFITLVLIGASVLMLGATLSRTTAGTRLNDRNCSYIMAGGAAEAAVEKVLARMMVDYAKGGDSQVAANVSLYKTNFLPTTTENSYWTNFTWSDAQGHDSSIYVSQTSTQSNNVLSSLTEQYAGLSGYCSTYRILANARLANSTYNYGFTNAVQQDVQLAQIPVFQFAIFYNSLLEFTDTATLTVSGRVHANDNIYVGSPSALTFNALVTSTGTITAPANDGYGTGSWSGSTTYNSGKVVGYSALTLPIGTNNTADAVHQILLLPQAGDDVNMSSQRYYNKADLTMVLSTISGVDTMTFTFKNSTNDPSIYSGSAPLTSVIGVNDDLTLAANSFSNINTTARTINTYFGMRYWMDNDTFYDFREGKTISVTEINVGNLTNWINNWLLASSPATNHPIAGKFNSSSPFNIIYFADTRTPPTGTLYALRLTNGVNLPAAGLTVATLNPLYISGNYNCPIAGNWGTTNTIGCAPASVACDALTILSSNWSDYGSSVKLGSRVAPNSTKADTVNCAIIAGIVYSTGTSSTTFSGGVENFPRLLEDWQHSTLTLNTSMVCLFNSTYGSTMFKNPGPTNNVYVAPQSRLFSFDQNFKTSAGMPPGTPNICRLVRQNWSNPPPGIVNATNLSSWDYVAR